MSIEKFTDDSRIRQEIIPFTQVNTKVVQNISNLEAGFVWVYLLTMPRNWRIVKAHLKNHFKIGNAKIKKIFSYLHTRGLIEYTRVREADGRVARIDIRILNGSRYVPDHVQAIGSEIDAHANCTPDTPLMHIVESNEINDLDEVCTTGSESDPVDYQPSSSGPLQNKQNTKETEKQKVNISRASKDARTSNDSSFEQFWNIYPIKKNKIRTKKIWDKKKYNNIATLICADVDRRKREEAQWKDAQFIPHPDTYLRNERWTDDITKATSKKTSGNSAFSDFLAGSNQSGATYDEHGNAINPFN